MTVIFKGKNGRNVKTSCYTDFFPSVKFVFASLFRAQRLKFRLNLYELKEGRQIKPKTFMSMVSNLLYERR